MTVCKGAQIMFDSATDTVFISEVLFTGNCTKTIIMVYMPHVSLSSKIHSPRAEMVSGSTFVQAHVDTVGKERYNIIYKYTGQVGHY